MFPGGNKVGAEVESLGLKEFLYPYIDSVKRFHSKELSLVVLLLLPSLY